MPFLGDRSAAAAAIATLGTIATAEGDRLLLADNSPGRVAAGLDPGPVEIVDASATRSASYARNAGAATADTDWLLFIDADCEPPPAILDSYFAKPVDESCAVIAGEVAGVDEQGSLLARWARSRRGLWVSHHLDSGPHPGGITANLLVRRAAFEAAGGFRIGGGGDLDLCWRLQDAGWQLEYRPDVVVRHRDRERLGELLGQAVAYGGHQRHLRDLHGPAVEPVRLARPLARGIGGGAVHAARGEGDAARFGLVDAAWAAAQWWGWAGGGRWARRAD